MECLASAAGCTGDGAPPPVSTLKPVNRTLVVLLGNARGGEETWESLYTNLLDPQSADLALAFGDTASGARGQPLAGLSLGARAKHVWFLHEPSDWGDVLDAAAEVS